MLSRPIPSRRKAVTGKRERFTDSSSDTPLPAPLARMNERPLLGRGGAGLND